MAWMALWQSLKNIIFFELSGLPGINSVIVFIIGIMKFDNIYNTSLVIKVFSSMISIYIIYILHIYLSSK